MCIKMEKGEGGEEKKQRKGPCCVCKTTKTARDECVMRFSEENCVDAIQAHIACLKDHGFM